jgi:hypothetical protein
MIGGTLFIDTLSEPGAYADALRFPHSIRVTEVDCRPVPVVPAVAIIPLHWTGNTRG